MSKSSFSASDPIDVNELARLLEIANRELERRRKVGDYRRGRTNSPEHNRKIGEGRRRAYERPGARAAHSTAMKAWHARKRAEAQA